MITLLTFHHLVFLFQYINGHFDTTVGAKTESKSYKEIAESISLKPSRILFVTDVINGKLSLLCCLGFCGNIVI